MKIAANETGAPSPKPITALVRVYRAGDKRPYLVGVHPTGHAVEEDATCTLAEARFFCMRRAYDYNDYGPWHVVEVDAGLVETWVGWSRWVFPQELKPGDLIPHRGDALYRVQDEWQYNPDSGCYTVTCFVTDRDEDRVSPSERVRVFTLDEDFLVQHVLPDMPPEVDDVLAVYDAARDKYSGQHLPMGTRLSLYNAIRRDAPGHRLLHDFFALAGGMTETEDTNHERT